MKKTIQGSEELAAAREKDPPRPAGRIMLNFFFVPAVHFAFFELHGIKAALISSMFQIGGASSIPFIAESLHRFGRRFGMFIGCFLVVMGSIIQGTSSIHHSLMQFLVGRFFVGFGVNVSISRAPLYVVEISHSQYRGVMTGLHNCIWFIGSISASAVTRGSNSLTGNMTWLIPVWVQIFFPGIVCLGVWFLPESCPYLFTHGQKDKAKEFITYYHGSGDPNNAYVTLQLAEFEASLELEGADKRWWISGRWLIPSLINIGSCAVLQCRQ
jgi:MFS family permease